MGRLNKINIVLALAIVFIFTGAVSLAVLVLAFMGIGLKDPFGGVGVLLLSLAIALIAVYVTNRPINSIFTNIQPSQVPLFSVVLLGLFLVISSVVLFGIP